jgi:hypothetical protein
MANRTPIEDNDSFALHASAVAVPGPAVLRHAPPIRRGTRREGLRQGAGCLLVLLRERCHDRRGVVTRRRPNLAHVAGSIVGGTLAIALFALFATLLGGAMCGRN